MSEKIKKIAIDQPIKIAWKTYNILKEFKMKEGMPIKRITDRAVAMYIEKYYNDKKQLELLQKNSIKND